MIYDSRFLACAMAPPARPETAVKTPTAGGSGDYCPRHNCRLVKPEPTMEKVGGEWRRIPAEKPFCHKCVEESLP